MSAAAALFAFALLFVALHACARSGRVSPEVSRKLFHTGSGLLTLSFPFLFRDVRPVLFLTSASAAAVTAIKFIPPLGERLGGVANRVERSTLGEIYFPVSVAALFWLTVGRDPLLFVIPILMLTFADATCALIGGRYGLTRYVGSEKSLEGSATFAVVAFFCVHVPLLLWGHTGRAETLLIAATLALLVMLLEGSAWRGLDNLFIPIGGYVLLRAYLPLDAVALVGRFLVTNALVCALVLSRGRTTLEDDALLAGAFICYVAWALMGWQWLVAPIAVFVGHAWLSPATPDNSRRIHDVPALLSVWTAAVAWLVAARAAQRPALLFPYTIVFATHLAMFGMSRLASQFPARAIGPLFWRAVLASWMLVMVPFVASAGATRRNLASVAIAIGAMALGTAMFVGTQAEIRNVPLTLRRWMLQAGAAAVASIAAWTLVRVLS